jgi:hypothetical protein
VKPNKLAGDVSDLYKYAALVNKAFERFFHLVGYEVLPTQQYYLADNTIASRPDLLPVRWK